MGDFMGANSSLGLFDHHLIADFSVPFKWMREYHKWEHIENEKGKYKWESGWPQHTSFVRACRERGINLDICVERAVPWASSNGTPGGIPLDNGDGSAENNYRERAVYMAQIAARYGKTVHPAEEILSPDKLSGLDAVHYYEDFNEEDQWWQKPLWPGEKYAKFLHAVQDGRGCASTGGPRYGLLGIKAGDPKALHVLGGLADSTNTRYLDAIVGATGGRLPFDVLNFHEYASDFKSTAFSPENEAHGLKKAVEVMKSWRDAKAPGKPMWVSEFGWDTFKNPSGVGSYTCVPELTQANYLMRGFALLKGWGVDKAFMFQFEDANSSDVTQYASSGVVTDTKSGSKKKMSFYYLATMQAVLGDFYFLKMEKTARGTLEIYSCLFRDAANTKYVQMLWVRGSGSSNDTGLTVKNYKLAIPRGTHATQIKPVAGSLTGQESPLRVSRTGAAAFVTIPQLSETPLFVSYSGSASTR